MSTDSYRTKNAPFKAAHPRRQNHAVYAAAPGAENPAGGILFPHLTETYLSRRFRSSLRSW